MIFVLKEQQVLAQMPEGEVLTRTNIRNLQPAIREKHQNNNNKYEKVILPFSILATQFILIDIFLLHPCLTLLYPSKSPLAKK